MTGLYFIIAIVLIVLYIVMMSTMIILERDKPKNIIIWSMIFLVSQIVGYVVYLLIRAVFYKKRNSLDIKLKEDEIYEKMIAKNLNNSSVELNHEVFRFNTMAYNAKLTANNNYEIIKNYKDFKDNLIEDLIKAKHYIILELTKINAKDFETIKEILIEKAKSNVEVKLVYDQQISFKLIKELKLSGVKVYRFSKYNTIGKVYSNLRNSIIIDGEISYIANLKLTNRQLKQKFEISCAFLKIKGDVVQDINLQTHKDAIFASGKYIPFKKHDKLNYSNTNYFQFVANQANTDLELAIIKSICMAKKSIQLELSNFIPTESIMSLLKFAINSNIEVRLMVPLKNANSGKYFASRAYAKELALFGANVYLFDGYINFNAITIDDEYVLFGSFIIDREHLNTSAQSIILIKDNKAVKNFNELFNSGVKNSYRINNAKLMLLREKFFKNFV